MGLKLQMRFREKIVLSDSSTGEEIAKLELTKQNGKIKAFIEAPRSVRITREEIKGEV